jgi:putative transposase
LISIRRQCQLLSLPHSSYYYLPRESDEVTLELLKLIDEEYTRHPFIGTRRMVNYLGRLGYPVNRKRVQNLYKTLGIEALYPKKNLSQRSLEHRVYPYLLKGVKITHCNQVWSVDITYIRLKTGYLYLVAIIDWFSRYVLDWRLSNSLEADFCVDSLMSALDRHAGCEIFNSDQGSQFTSMNFTKALLEKGIKISMDGRGRALDNVFVERLWRSVKYECIYLRDFYQAKEVNNVLKDYFEYYNHARPHQSLGYKTPAEIYFP